MKDVTELVIIIDKSGSMHPLTNDVIGGFNSLIEEQKKENRYALKKYSSELKERKAKGEIVDSWYQVVLVKSFNDPKEPVEEIEVTYA